jgi:hypothetical protein
MKKITSDMKLIKVLASQARNENVTDEQRTEAADIMAELATDMSPENRYQLAQVFAYTIDELQDSALDFLNTIADQKTVPYGGKPAFNVKTGGIKAYFQAKGSTTPRSMVSGKQILIDTEEVSARPAIPIMQIRTKQVEIADLIREANNEMTNAKIKKIEQVLQASISTYASPFYATGTGINKDALQKQINYFRRFGPVTILGDMEAVSQLASLTGMAMSNSLTQHSENQINELNDSGFIGRYMGCNVIALTNAFEADGVTPILQTNWLYIIPGGMTGDTRNLKVVTEGSVSAVESQDINDLVYEIRLDQWFGCAFVTGKNPTIGAYKIG